MAEPANQPNPYRASESVGDSQREYSSRASWRLILGGALWSIGMAFPIAAAMALVYRFPIPFAGYRSGVDAIIPAMIAVIVYGILGGFVVLGIAGAIAGLITGFLPGTRRTRNLMLFACSSGLTTIGLFVLAILDKIIGPW